MEGGKVLLDASSYMLIEASGDSDHQSDNYDTAELAAEDDAESCSFSSLATCAVVQETDGGGVDDFLDSSVEDYSDDNVDDDCGMSEVEDGVVDQCCGGAAVAMPAELNKPKGCEDSIIKERRDKDRLFWEACLAS